MIAAWTLAAAWAAPDAVPPTLEDPKKPLFQDTRVFIRGLAEALNDSGIDTVYGAGFRTIGVGIAFPIWKGLGIEVEFAYARLKPEDENSKFRMDIIPIAFLPEWTFSDKNKRFNVYFAVGPTFTAFSERHDANEEGLTVTRGGRFGVEPRVGLRIDTGLIKSPMPPADGSPVKALEIELYVGRRFQLPHDKGWGFDLASWRGGIGIGLRF